MAIYPNSPPHERLDVFFGEFFREMRKADPATYGAFLNRAEEEFTRLGYREEISAGVENILIVRFDGIGDMILTSGFLREVRANFPKARITLVIFSKVYSVVELCPYINEVLVFPVDNPLTLSFLDLLETIAIFCRDNNFWQKKFSIAFSPRWHNDDPLSALLLCWLSGARERIGYGTNPYTSWTNAPVPPIDNFLLTKNIVTPRSVISDAEKNFYLLAASGFKVNETHMELFYGAEDLQQAKIFLKNIPVSRKKVLLGIGGGTSASKKYPIEKYLIALKKLAKKDLVFIIVGGQAEMTDAEFIENNLPSGKVLNFVGKTTLRETEAVVSQANFYIGNDTGVMHMASAAQVPVLIIYSEAKDKENNLAGIMSSYGRFPPYKTKYVALRPDHQLDECAKLGATFGWCHSKEAHCITQITPQEIITNFETLQRL